MGEARRRGTLEQRIAQAIERQKIEDAAAHERYRQDEAERLAKILALPPQERRQAILSRRTGPLSHHLALALAAGLLALPPRK